jgi:hypothetical protein
MSRSKNEIIEAIKTRCGEEYKIMSPYKGRHEKITCKHLVCGYVWDVEAGAFLGNKNKKGSGCPNCYGNIKKTDHEFKEEVKRITNGEYVVLGTYKNAKEKVRILHLKCNRSRLISPNAFLSSYNGSCPFCHSGHQLSQSDASKKISKISENEYVLVGKYINAHTRIKVKHLKCGSIISTTLQSIESKGHVPKCKKCYPNSKGEAYIEKILDDLELAYIPQKTFKGLKIKNRGNANLSYDFFIPKYKCLIEYQGRQHYMPVSIFGGEEEFKYQVKRDEKKKNFAIKNGYNLISIPYTIDKYSSIKSYILNNI